MTKLPAHTANLLPTFPELPTVFPICSVAMGKTPLPYNCKSTEI